MDFSSLLGSSAASMPQMSQASGYTPPLSGAIGSQTGQSLDPNMFNGSSQLPTASMDPTKLADALKSFSSSHSSPKAESTPQSPHNAQEDYQRYLNAFNTQARG